MSGREELLLERMKGHIAAIHSHLGSMAREDFLADVKTKDAVYMRIFALAECVVKLRAENLSIIQNYPEAEWEGIVGLRNRLSHEYLGILPSFIWSSTRNLDDLARIIQKIIEDISA
jgi:uncharacterized protein with HEPN domain